MNRLAPATVKTRSAQLRAYEDFASSMNITSFPPTPDEVTSYASWLMLSRCGRETSLRQYLSALKTYFNQLNLWVPAPREYGPLGAVVDGAKRLFPGPVRRSLPVSVPILHNLITSVPPRQADDRQRLLLQVLKDTVLLLFFTMLRSSSLFPPSLSEADPLRNLTWERVKFTNFGAVIFVMYAKTNQFHQRVHRVVLKEKMGSIFCPVAALRRLRDMRGLPAHTLRDHVFQTPSRIGGWSVLTKPTVNRWFRGRISAMGLSAERYFLHGFRHGAISLALAEEPNINMIKIQSDHLSESVWSYAQVDVNRRLSVASKMVDALDNFRPAPEQGEADLHDLAVAPVQALLQ